MKFNDIANAISIISGVTLAGIVGVGAYIYVNKDAIMDNIKDVAIESVMGGLGGGLSAPDLPIGAPDLAPSAGQSAGLGLAIPSSPL